MEFPGRDRTSESRHVGYFSSSSDEDTGQQASSIETIPLDTEKVVVATGIRVPILRKFFVQTINQKKSNLKVSSQACDTLTYAITLYVTRILERAIRIARLRNQEIDADNVCISSVPSLSFALLRAEQDAKANIIHEEQLVDDDLSHFVDLLGIKSVPIKLPHDMKHTPIPRNAIQALPQRPKEEGITIHDLIHVLESEGFASPADLQTTKISIAARRTKP